MSLPAVSLATLDACAQAELVRRREVTALELADAAIARIERLNPQLNAVVATGYEAARDRALRRDDGASLRGVPTLIKDLLPYPGLPLALGGRFLPPFPMPAGSPYTDALDRAGLIVLGKSATSEFGLLGTTEPASAAPTRNPWDLGRSTGGSSGGAVAAVASGMVPVAHASDGGGSIRGPSSFCGLFGFKPSRGRTISAGVPEDTAIGQMLSDHCVSRSVRDSIAWLHATERPGWALPPLDALRARRRRLTIGVYRPDNGGNPPDPDAAAALDQAERVCAALGHDLVEVAGPAMDTHTTGDAFFALSGRMVATTLDMLGGMLGEACDESRLDPYSRDIVARARALPEDALAAAAATLAAAALAAERSMAAVDVLLSPTVGFAAFPLGLYAPDQSPEKLAAFVVRVAGYTVPASLAGQPAMSVPLHWTSGGLPMGSHFTAAAGDDATLFSLALALEEAQPWQPRLNALIEGLYAATA